MVSKNGQTNPINYQIPVNDDMILKEKGMMYLHRDISWLSFNYRVLQEAMDTSVPLFERIRFLAIYSSNLDEFFRVRMANHRNLLRVSKKAERELEFSSKSTVREVQKIVDDQQAIFSEIFENQIIPELKQHLIFINRKSKLNEEQQAFVEDYFQDHMLPYVQPVLLVKNKIKPFLNNASLYLTILLKDKIDKSNSYEYALVKVPSDELPRFIELPSSLERKEVIMLDDIVRLNLPLMFPGYEVLDSYSIKLTRDAELYIDDEFSGDLVQKIKESLAKRHVGPASRFVYDREMPKDLLKFLVETFDLEKYDIYKEGRYHNNFDFFQFPSFNLHHLEHPALPPLPYEALEKSPDFFNAMKHKDHLLNYPYHSYESVVKFFEQAAMDPKVTHIKIIQYRVARKSRIMNALMRAVSVGKQVSVFIEVKARFDEAANLKWGDKLEKAGVNVHYSFPGVKVHSKLALVRRNEGFDHKMYAYLSTGNFHEGTAKIYSDFGFFTADPNIVNEVARIFSFLETVKMPQQSFDHLLVGQFNLRSGMESLIDFEIRQAKQGLPAEMTIKLNSLQDKRMINKLYEANRAGVKINLIIRGICCLVPGVPGLSENIRAVSIVDRFLEHARVFIFHHGGDEKIYLSSADWMVRNLNYRVECAFPINDTQLKMEIKDLINIQLNDNVKARKLDKDLSNQYVKEGPEIAIRSQMESYFYYKRKRKG